MALRLLHGLGHIKPQLIYCTTQTPIMLPASINLRNPNKFNKFRILESALSTVTTGAYGINGADPDAQEP